MKEVENNNENIINENNVDPRFKKPLNEEEIFAKEKADAEARAKNVVDENGVKGIKTGEGLDSYKSLTADGSGFEMNGFEFNKELVNDAGEDLYNEKITKEVRKENKKAEQEKLRHVDDGIKEVDEELEGEEDGIDKVEELEDVPLKMTKEIETALKEARAKAEAEVREEHNKAKAEYDKAVDLRQRIVSYSEYIMTAQKRIMELSEGSDKDSDLTKDNIKYFQDQIKDVTEKRMKISAEEESAALQTIEAFEKREKELTGRIVAAKTAAEEKVLADFKKKQDEERVADFEMKRYDAYVQSKFETNDSRKVTVDKFDAKNQGYYMEDLSNAIADAENASKDDIYRINVNKDINGDFIDFRTFSKMDLINAEQAFDRTFRGLDNFFYKYKYQMGSPVGSHLIENMYINTKQDSVDDPTMRDVKWSVFEKTREIMRMCKMDPRDYTVQESRRFEKLLIMSLMQSQRFQITFEPGIIKDGKLVRATENDKEFYINFNSLPGVEKTREEKNALKNEGYTRIPFEQMVNEDPYIGGDWIEPKEEKKVEVEAGPFDTGANDEEYKKNKSQIDNLKIGLRGNARTLAEDGDDSFEGVDEIERRRKEEEQRIKEERYQQSKEELERRRAERREEDPDYNDNYTVLDIDIEEKLEDLEEEQRAEDNLLNFEREDNFDPEKKGALSAVGVVDLDDAKNQTKAEKEARRAERQKEIQDLKIQLQQINLESVKMTEQERERRTNDYLESHNGMSAWDMKVMSLPIKALYAVSSNLSAFKEEVEELNQNTTITNAALGMQPHESTLVPGTQTNATRELVTSPDGKKSMAENMVAFDKLFSGVFHAENYIAMQPVNEQPNVRIVNIIEELQKIAESPYLEEVYNLVPREFLTLDAGFTTFPYNSFYQGMGEDNKPIFAPDNARYAQMMKDIPFLDVLEESVHFVNHVVIPNVIARKDHALSKNEIEQYNVEYREHLEKQQNLFKKMATVKADNKDINDLKPFKDNVQQGFFENWNGNRMGKSVIRDANKDLAIMDRGWPANDVALIKELANVQTCLRDRLEVGALSDAEKKKAQDLLRQMEPLMKRVNNEYIVSQEIRDALIDKFAAPINEFVAWEKQTNPMIKDSAEKRANYSAHAIDKIYKEAVKRPVYDAEVGNAKLRVVNKRPTAISDELIKANVNMMVDDLHAVEVSMFGSAEFKEMKEYLEDLKKYTDRGFTEDRIVCANEDEGYRLSLTTFRSKAERTLEKVKKYFERKETDFNDSPNRRDKKGKQGVEQSRIRMSINLYDKLSYLVDHISAYEDSLNLDPVKNFEKGELQELKAQTKEILNNKIEEEAKKLATVNDKKEYQTIVGRIANYYMLTQNSFYNMRNGESIEECRQRIQSLQTKTYTYDDIKKQAMEDRIFKKIIGDASHGFGEDDFVRSEKNDIIASCRDKIKSIAHTMQGQSKSQERKTNSKYYKDRLVSTQNKEARQLRVEQKNAPNKK